MVEKDYMRLKDHFIRYAGLCLNETNRKLPIHKIIEISPKYFERENPLIHTMALLIDDLMLNHKANKDFKKELLERVANTFDNILTDIEYELI